MSTELAWAAGFFDGEGSVSIRVDKRPGRKPALQLSIEQNDPRPLHRFALAVGHGRVTCRKAIRPPARKVMYRVAMGHAATVSTIIALWPWLSEPKREQYARAAQEVIRLDAAAVA